MSLPFLGKCKAEIRALSLLGAGISSCLSPRPWGTAQVTHSVREMGGGVGTGKRLSTQTSFAFICCVYWVVGKIYLKRDSPGKGGGGGEALP